MPPPEESEYADFVFPAPISDSRYYYMCNLIKSRALTGPKFADLCVLKQYMLFWTEDTPLWTK